MSESPFKLTSMFEPKGDQPQAIEQLMRGLAQDDLEPVFGHVPHDGYDYETYTEGLGTGVSYGYDQTLNAQRYSTAPAR